MTIVELTEMIDKDLTLNLENLNSKVFQIPNLYSKYMKLFLKEKTKLNKINRDIDIMYCAKYKYFSTEYNFKLSNKEIEFHIAGEEEYSNMKLKFNNQKALVDILDRTATRCSYLNTDIKNILEYLKYVQGV